jgi:hypothetical protein
MKLATLDTRIFHRAVEVVSETQAAPFSTKDQRHEFETRFLPCSLVAGRPLPSISLIPSARFTNSH